MALFGLLGKKKEEREAERLGLRPEELGLGAEKLGFGEEEFTGAGITPREEAPVAAPPFAGMQQVPTPPSPMFAKDIELLSAKLDAIRAVLENISTRLASLERIARGESEHYERY